MSQEELQQILTQLRNLMRSTAPPPPPPAPVAQSWSAPQAIGPSTLPPPAPFAQPPHQPYAAPPPIGVKIEGSTASAPISLPPANVHSIQNLSSSLVKAGVVQAPTVHPEAGPSRQDTPTPSLKKLIFPRSLLYPIARPCSRRKSSSPQVTSQSTSTYH